MGGKRPRQSHDVSVLPDDAGVASVTERYTRETDVYASQRRTGSNLADLGRRRRVPVSLIAEAGELPGMSAGLRGGRGDVLRGSHGDVAGAESDASSAERSTSEHGNHPWSARWRRGQRRASGWAHRRPTGQGWGGAAVVVAGVTTCRGGRESRPQGEGRQWFQKSRKTRRK